MKNWLKRLWIKINTCHHCGMVKGHTKECYDYFWDGFAFGNEQR